MLKKRRALIALACLALPLAGGAQANAAPRTIAFSGETWTVKESRGKVGPGPNYFSASTKNVWVDTQGRLHLRIAKNRGKWWSAEVIGTRSLGHGTYTWTLDSPVDALNPNAVLGLFTWSNTAGYANRELDIEFSRWGNPFAATNAQFVVQPYDAPGHWQPFVQPSVASSEHGFTWAPGSVAFRSSSGSVPSWTYLGGDVPPAGDETPRMNLWLAGGSAPTDGNPVEVIIRSFTFTPLPTG
jgi:hypothetical protein